MLYGTAYRAVVVHSSAQDKRRQQRPTAFMMVTKFAGVIVVQLGPHRQLARPLPGVQHQYLTALEVPATCFTLPAGS
jgi:hypothetical protein